MKNRFLRALAALLVALTASFALAACGGGTPAAPGGSGGGEPAAGESEAFVNDLKAGVKLVNDQIKAQAGMTQIMLASDVDRPTQKYGMWVLPFKPSDAVKKFTQTIEITNGTDFVVTAVSAETDKTWTMDQAENMAEVTK